MIEISLWIKTFLLAFAPLFFAINAIGVLPIFIGLTSELPSDQKRVLVFEATLTATVLSLVFLVGGKLVFQFMGVTPDDFRVAGGIMLFLIATSDLVFAQHLRRRNPDGKIGIVPIGSPLIIGPGAITTIMMLVDLHGMLITSFSVVTNLTFVWLIFRYSEKIISTMGKGMTHAIGKIFALFLGAMAIRMIRIGIENFIRS